MSLKKIQFLQLHEFLQDRHLQVIYKKCPFCKAILVSIIVLKASWRLHPNRIWQEETKKPSCSHHHLHSRPKSMSLAWIKNMLLSRMWLCVGRSSLKIACLLPGHKYQERGIEKYGNWEGGKSLKLCPFAALSYFVSTRNLQIHLLTLHHITSKRQMK